MADAHGSSIGVDSGLASPARDAKPLELMAGRRAEPPDGYGRVGARRPQTSRRMDGPHDLIPCRVGPQPKYGWKGQPVDIKALSEQRDLQKRSIQRYRAAGRLTHPRTPGPKPALYE